MLVKVKSKQGKRHTSKNVTVGVRTITLLVLGEQRQLYIDDLDLRMEGNAVTLTLDHRLL